MEEGREGVFVSPMCPFLKSTPGQRVCHLKPQLPLAGSSYSPHLGALPFLPLVPLQAQGSWCWQTVLFLAHFPNLPISWY